MTPPWPRARIASTSYLISSQTPRTLVGHHPVEVGRREPLDRAIGGDACVVERRVDLAELIDRAPDQGRDRRLVGDVGRDRGGAAVGGGDRVGDRLQLGLTPAGQNHHGTLAGERHGSRTADAAAGPGDQGDFSHETARAGRGPIVRGGPVQGVEHRSLHSSFQDTEDGPVP